MGGPWTSVPTIQRQGRPIECLHVHVAEPDHPEDDESTFQGIFNASLDRTRPIDWGPTLDEKLNVSGRIHTQQNWPVAIEPSGLCDGNAARHRVRLLLYSLWLVATFEPQRLGDSSVADPVIAELRGTDHNGLKPLIERIQRLCRRDWWASEHLVVDEFSHWYTLAIQPTVDLPFAKDSRALGSAMLFSGMPIHQPLLRECRRTIESIYLSMRYFEAAILYEQQGLDTQAHGFAHDIKKLSTALSQSWVVPLDALFTSELGPTVLSDAKIGSVRIDDPYLASELGIAPLRSCVLAIGTIMRLWSVLDLKQEFPDLNPEELSTAELTRACWKRVCDTAIATMLVGQGYAFTDVHQLRKAVQLKELLVRLVNLCRLEITGESIVHAHQSEAVTLARLLFAVLKNALQHGDPLKPIIVSIDAGSPRILRLRCANHKFDWLTKLYPHDELGKRLNVDVDVARQLAGLLHKRTNRFEESTVSFTSLDTIQDCTQRLGGTVSWSRVEDPSPEYLVEISVPREGGSQ